MRFEGEHLFSLTRPRLFDLLGDARFLVGCLPDATDVRAPGPDEAACSVRPSLSFVRGSLAVTLHVAERQAPAALRFVIHSKAIGSAAEVESRLAFAEVEGGTRVDWQTDITRLSGLLKMVPAGLIRGAAQQVINDLWAHIEKRVQATAGEP